MLGELNNARVYLAIGSTDMRKSINGLSILIREQLDIDVFSGSLFVFCNYRRTILKILYWDRNGFCLWQKRLEQDKFNWPMVKAEVLQIDRRQLRWLLDGLDIFQAEAYKQLYYSQLC